MANSSVAERPSTTLDKLPVTARHANAKASIADKTDADSLSSVVKEAAKRAHGKQGAAAAVLGKDEGNFSRDVQAERTTIADLRKLGPQFLAELGTQLTEAYGALVTPHARVREAVRDIRRRCDEIDSYLEYLAS